MSEETVHELCRVVCFQAIAANDMHDTTAILPLSLASRQLLSIYNDLSSAQINSSQKRLHDARRSQLDGE